MKPFHEYRFDRIVHISLIICLCIVVICIALLAAVPPVSRDALIHHLALPKLYLKHGSFYQTPSLVFSYYPMNLDLLYMIPLYFGNDIVPKYIHFTFALLTAFLIYRFLKQRLNRNYALLGALFFLTIPIVVNLSITVYVDLGLIFFSLLSIIMLFRWLENRYCISDLIACGIFCGIAMGVKYNGLIVLMILSASVAYLYLGHRRDEPDFLTLSNAKIWQEQGIAIMYALIFVFFAGLMFSPWMIKNYIWTHNPIYPLFNSLFNDAQTTGGHISHFVVRRQAYGESVFDILLIPIRIFFQGQDGNPQYFDGKLNPGLLILPIFAFVLKSHENRIPKYEKWFWLMFSFFFLMFAFFLTSMRIRYIGPIIPGLVILSMMGLYNIKAWISKLKNLSVRYVVFTGMCIGIVYIMMLNATYIKNQFSDVEPFSYMTGKLSREQYIEKYRPEYYVITYINKYLPKDAKIWCIFMGDKSYYFDRQVVFDLPQFDALLKQVKNPLQLYLYLKQQHISHLMIRYDLFNQWIETQYDPDQKIMLKAFLNSHTKQLCSKGIYGVYALVE